MKKNIRINPFLLLFSLIISLVAPPTTIGNFLIAIQIGVFGFYFYHLAHTLFKRLPYEHDLNIKLFDLHLFYAVAYLIATIIYFHGNYAAPKNYILDNHEWYLALIIPLQFFGGFTVFYCMYWLSKCIVTIRSGRVVPFDSFAPTFFLMVLFPLGLFWILPEVRSILKSALS